MNSTPPVQIQHLPAREACVAAQLCARSMRDNPLHVLAFGADRTRRQRRVTRFFATLIPVIHARGMVFGAYADRALIGVLGMLPPGTCRSVRLEVLRRLPSLVLGNSAIGALRRWRWLGTWAGNDPREPHWHVGPLAVTPERQAQGVGSRLMAQGIVGTGEQGAFMYLETDKPANVRFYKKSAFRVVAVLPVLGMSNWFMQRDSGELPQPPGNHAPDGPRQAARFQHLDGTGEPIRREARLPQPQRALASPKRWLRDSAPPRGGAETAIEYGPAQLILKNRCLVDSAD